MSISLLLCTDLDRTLIPNGREPESPDARPRFHRFVAQAGITLAYVTGRHQTLVEQAIAEYALPWPDYVIGDVGTSIQAVQLNADGAARWSPLPRWLDVITQTWPGPRTLQALFADLAGLRLQEDAKQTPFKLSYYVSLDLDADDLLARLNERLASAETRANLIWSVDETAAVGLLDVLPEQAGKYHAVAFLMRALGCGESATVFAGDSGNDLEVLTSPIPSILVANAHPQIREQAHRAAAARGLEVRLYCARGGWSGMNGNYGAGILEGVAHFRPDLLDLLLASGDG
ncbi:haloacid dehalogenase [Thiocystis minor]|uniref:HAD family hydrolase n=1 Tax=Thiocystis minor TaxID=61597 RepID=UPI001911EC20|nr:HAD family hydrolase [Thiocystis minor]MBK5963214.1 haloacid dehalogenase [Thiocystis minor]